MSRIDTGEYARITLAGLNQGINLGENADRMRFAQDRAAQADQQQAFTNSQQQIEMDLRRRQVEAAMMDREKRVQEREKERQAITLSMNLAQMDDASYVQAVNANADILSYAPEGVQRMIGSRSTLQRENKSAQAKYDAAVQAGQKLDAEQVAWLRDRGVLVSSQHKVRTQQEIDEAEDAQDRQSLIGMSLARGEIGWEDVPAMSRFNNTNMLAARLGMFRQANEAAIQRKQEEQRAAAEAQSTQANQERFFQDATAAGANPAQMRARISADRVGIPLGENPFGGQSDSAARAGLKQRIDAAEAIYKLAQDDAKVLEEKATSGAVSGDGLMNWQSSEDRKVIQEYEAAMAKVEAARRQYEALAQQAMGGGASSSSFDPRQRLAELKAQGVPRDQAIAIVEQEMGTQTTPSTQPR